MPASEIAAAFPTVSLPCPCRVVILCNGISYPAEQHGQVDFGGQRSSRRLTSPGLDLCAVFAMELGEGHFASVCGHLGPSGSDPVVSPALISY